MLVKNKPTAFHKYNLLRHLTATFIPFFRIAWRVNVLKIYRLKFCESPWTKVLIRWHEMTDSEVVVLHPLSHIHSLRKSVMLRCWADSSDFSQCCIATPWSYMCGLMLYRIVGIVCKINSLYILKWYRIGLLVNHFCKIVLKKIRGVDRKNRYVQSQVYDRGRSEIGYWRIWSPPSTHRHFLLNLAVVRDDGFRVREQNKRQREMLKDGSEGAVSVKIWDPYDERLWGRAPA